MLSSILAYFSKILDVVLRLPPLFVMDMILKSRYSITFDLVGFSSYGFNYVMDIFRKGRNFGEHGTLSVFHIVFGLMHLLGFISAMYSFLLPTKQLLSAYVSAASVAVIFWSYVMNVEYIKYCINLINHGTSLQHELFALDQTTVQVFFANYAAQIFWAIIFCFSSTSLPNFPPKRLIAGISFISPALLSITSMPDYILHNVPIVATMVEISFLAYYLLKHRRMVYVAILSPIQYLVHRVDNYAFIHSLIEQWKNINVYQVFQVFWYFRAAKQLVSLINNAKFLELIGTGFFPITKEASIFVVQEILKNGCDTFLAVIGLTCVLSSFIVFVVSHMHSFLTIPSNSSQNLAHVASVLFITLAIQTGLTGLAPAERLLRAYRNIVLMFATVLYNIHEDIHSALSAISTAGNASVGRHVKVIFGGLLLLLYSCSILVFLFIHHSVSPWFLAATAFSIEVIIKIVISFTVFILNIVDNRCTTTWENLDDYLFFITAGGHFANFLLNLFLFFNACYIVVYESFGITRVVLIVVHLYYNICGQIRNAVAIYNHRCIVLNIVNSLPEATPEQLKAFDDVCSVCYQSLHKARITMCNHFFHGICLRKWLYEQHTCPFCHKPISIRLDGHEHQA